MAAPTSSSAMTCSPPTTSSTSAWLTLLKLSHGRHCVTTTSAGTWVGRSPSLTFTTQEKTRRSSSFPRNFAAPLLTLILHSSCPLPVKEQERLPITSALPSTPVGPAPPPASRLPPSARSHSNTLRTSSVTCRQPMTPLILTCSVPRLAASSITVKKC